MALSHGAVLAAILLLLGGIGSVLLGRSLDSGATASILGVAREEADRIAETGVVRPPSDADLPSGSAVRIVVVTPDGLRLGEPGGAPSWLRPRASEVTTLVVPGDRIRVITLPVRDHGRLLATVVAGRSLAPEERILARLRLFLLLGGLGAVAASMVAGWWLAGRALRPVRRAYEAQAGFAADASHELRTPLAFVRSGVEVLAESDPELGEEVLHEIDYLTGLTERLLTLARAQSGTLSLQRRPISLAEVCRRAADRNARVHGLTLELLAEGRCEALADPVGTEAALDAVLENVARYGGGAAEIRVSKDRERIAIAVADHGSGLPSDQRDRAFERFFRADPSRTHEGGGAGLGLPLARSLVAAQGGRMWLEETPGGGLTAVIALDAAPAAAAGASASGEGGDALA